MSRIEAIFANRKRPSSPINVATCCSSDNLLSVPATKCFGSGFNGISDLSALSTRGAPSRSPLDMSYTSSPPAPSPPGIPRVAPVTQHTAPVHIDVGGCTYTTTLETLTRYEGSKLAKFFNGTIPISLDSLKQNYFLDRDGKMFRHILNYFRCQTLVLPEDFKEIDLLEQEAKYFEVQDLLDEITVWRARHDTASRTRRGRTKAVRHETVLATNDKDRVAEDTTPASHTPTIVSLRIESRSLGAAHDRAWFSGPLEVAEAIFPEAQNAIFNMQLGMEEDMSEVSLSETGLSAHALVERFLAHGFDVTCNSQEHGVKIYRFEKRVSSANDVGGSCNEKN